MTRLNVLLLYVQPASSAGTIGDHVGAFGQYSRHRVFGVSNLPAIHSSFGGKLHAFPPRIDLARFDALVLHYSNYLPSPDHLDDATRKQIREFQGLKIQFIQDEYRHVDLTTLILRDLGIDVLFTCVPEEEIEKVYPADRLPGVRKVSTLTGFVPEKLCALDVPPLRDRPIEVGYRARMVPFWLGDLGMEKWQIAPAFLEATARYGLRCDISYREDDRIYGTAWIRFLSSCRAMLGVESGASVFDFTGKIQNAVDSHMAQNPGARYEDVRARFLPNEQGGIRLNQISPRCFEAAALRTAMILYEGHYSGILRPWTHYLPLRKDFANIGDVVAALRDVEGLQAIVDRTFREIALNERWSYRAFVAAFDQVLDDAWAKAGRTPVRGYTGAGFGFAYALSRIQVLCQFPMIVLRAMWMRVPLRLRRALAPVLGRAGRRLRARVWSQPSN